MPRLTPLTTRDQVPAEAHAAFDAIAETRNRVGGPFAVMMHSPEVAARSAHLGTYLRFESSLPKPLIELATITAAHICECPYEWAAHERLAREAGVPEAAIEAARDGRLDGLDPLHALVVEYGRAILREHRVSEALFEDARTRLGERGVIDLTATFGYYAMLACMLNAADVRPA